MMQRWAIGAGGLVALIVLGAAPAPAATTPPKAPQLRVQIPADPFAGLDERFRNLAKRDERAQDWHRAIMRWKAVAALDPGDKEAASRLAALGKMLQQNAERHFKAAKAALQAKQYAKAFREFLRTLSYDPDNHLALAMVKHELNAKSINEYTVKRGDTLREIAVAQYDDPELTYLVQYYNGIDDPRKLEVGQVLRLPVVAGVMPAKPAPQVAAAPPKPAPGAPAEAPKAPGKAPAPPAAEAPAVAAQPPAEPALAAGAAILADEVQQAPATAAPEYGAPRATDKVAEAQGYFDAKQYEQAASTAEALLEEDPANNDLRALVNAAYYERGKELSEKKEYVAALQTLARVDPGYKDVKAVTASLKDQIKGQEAEVHYIAGVTAFLNEDLDTAIREWEETLKLDPSHPQAPKDLENARALRDKLARVQ